MNLAQPSKRLQPAFSVQRRSQPMPIDALMLEFESLGDNCEFGLIQRAAGVEPLGLLRFAGIHLPIEIRLEKLVAALTINFEGLGTLDTINVELAGEPGNREFLVRESKYDLMYHSFKNEGQIEADQRQHEATRLTFLRRKLLDDLKVGDKIWVWRSMATTTEDQIRPLLDILRRHGPNILLWVVEADEGHPAGTIQPIGEDCIKGYVERFAPYLAATDIRPDSWFEVCRNTYGLCRASVVDEIALTEAPEEAVQQLTAMAYLSNNPATLERPAPPAPSEGMLRRWLRRPLRW